MTDQERQLIENLIQRIRNAPPPQVDREASDLIRRGIGSHPDALYILVQSVLLQEMALNRANAQIEQLRERQPQGSFLGAERGYPAGGYQTSAYRKDAAPPTAAQYAPEPQRSRFSDFLHNAAQTAAGVVAGEVAFSALSSIFGHHGGYGGYGGYVSGPGFLGGGGGETIVNNYFEGNSPGHEHPLEHGLSPDLEDRRFADVADADNLGTDDSDYTDEASADDSSYDDGSDV